jgi:DNA polymerase-4
MPGKAQDCVVSKPDLAMVEILLEYSLLVQRFSVDECFMDFSEMNLIYDEPVATAHIIKDQIKNERAFP